MKKLEEIRARAEKATQHARFSTRLFASETVKLVAALEAVEVLHYVSENYNLPLCNECGDVYPCPTLTTIQEALR